VKTVDLSPDQSAARDAVHAWYGSGRPLMTLGGYAGTGKTTTLGAIAASLDHRKIAYCCFTGKASLVLESKLRAAGVRPDYCGTVHSLIYECDRTKGGSFRFRKVKHLDYDLIVIDEASMIGDELYKDLASYGVPILAVGDHGQLPPVSGKLNLMANPDIKLEHIHRQAEGSPIIRLSMMAREGTRIPAGDHGPGVRKTHSREVLSRIKDPKAGIVLCGTNATRVSLNAKLRRRVGPPVAGERVVCLKNDAEAGVYNGSIGEVVSLDEVCPNAGIMESGVYLCRKGCEKHYNMEFDFDGVSWRGPVVMDQFGSPKTIDDYARTRPGSTLGGQFDFAYAITTHKAQGSEFENVIVVEETDWMSPDDRRRWLYTAITRSKSKLLLIGR
jgi:exodeoxyribonuclease-5